MAIAAGADVNAFPGGGHQPPLHVAIEHQRVEIIRCLIAAGALLNGELSMPDWDFGGPGWTPLVHAIDIESDAAWQAHHETGHESTELTALLLASALSRPTERSRSRRITVMKRPWRCSGGTRGRAEHCREPKSARPTFHIAPLHLFLRRQGRLTKTPSERAGTMRRLGGLHLINVLAAP